MMGGIGLVEYPASMPWVMESYGTTDPLLSMKALLLLLLLPVEVQLALPIGNSVDCP